MDLLTPATLKTVLDAGGWVFSTVAVFGISTVIIRWLVGLNEKQADALKNVAQALDRLTDEVRASLRRR